MKKLILLIPFATVMAAPWMHRLVYENILLAIPAVGSETAHFLSFVSAIVMGFGVFIISMELFS